MYLTSMNARTRNNMYMKSMPYRFLLCVLCTMMAIMELPADSAPQHGGLTHTVGMMSVQSLTTSWSWPKHQRPAAAAEARLPPHATQQGVSG